MTKEIKAFFLGTVLIIIIYLSFKLRNDEAENIETFNQKDVGTIIHHGLKTIEFGYDYQGKDYVYTRDLPFTNLVDGEQYEIKIYKEDPGRILVSMDKPFIDTTNFKWGLIKPTKVQALWIDNSQVEFKFVVNDINYRRIQEYYYSDSIPKDFSKLKVIYRTDNPNISYLFYTDKQKAHR